MSLLLDPLGFDFMRNGLIEVLLLAGLAGTVGSFVVLRNLVFLGHALSHTVFPGIVLAYLLQVAPPAGALLATVVTIALLGALFRRPDVGHDSAIGIVFIGLFAAGIVLVGLFRVRAAALGDVLVGNILGVGATDLVFGAGLVVLAGGLLGLAYRGLVLAAFDPTAAQALGLPVLLLDLLLLGLVGATTLIAVQAVGVILTVAVLVTPASAARLWTRRLPPMMALAAALAALAGVAGLYIAYYVPVAASAVIVLALTATFGLSLLTGRRGDGAMG